MYLQITLINSCYQTDTPLFSPRDTFVKQNDSTYFLAASLKESSIGFFLNSFRSHYYGLVNKPSPQIVRISGCTYGVKTVVSNDSSTNLLTDYIMMRTNFTYSPLDDSLKKFFFERNLKDKNIDWTKLSIFSYLFKSLPLSLCLNFLDLVPDKYRTDEIYISVSNYLKYYKPLNFQEVQKLSSVKTKDGNSFDLSNIRGKVLLNFCKEGCGYSTRALKHLRDYEPKIRKKGYQIVTYYVGEDRYVWEALTDSCHWTHVSNLKDLQDSIPYQFGDITSYPYFLVLDEKKKVIFTHSGEDVKELESMMK